MIPISKFRCHHFLQLLVDGIPLEYTQIYLTVPVFVDIWTISNFFHNCKQQWSEQCYPYIFAL